MADTDSNRLPVDRKLLRRLFSKIKISTEHFYKGEPCWEWTAYLNNNGYGTFQYQMNGRNGKKNAHRLVYQFFVDIVPDDLVCDHLCRNRGCVNPLHIEPVTTRINLLRGIGVTALHAAKTHCPAGHEYTPENTLPCKRNIRSCRTCNRDRKRESYWTTQQRSNGATHCINGHEYTPANSYFARNGARRCRKCHCEQVSAAYYRKKAA